MSHSLFLANHLLLSLDWRLFALVIVNFPLYCLVGRALFGSFQAFFDSFPYVHGEVMHRRYGISTDDARIVQPHHPRSARSRCLFALCTAAYFAVTAAEYALVRLWFGPIEV